MLPVKCIKNNVATEYQSNTVIVLQAYSINMQCHQKCASGALTVFLQLLIQLFMVLVLIVLKCETIRNKNSYAYSF